MPSAMKLIFAALLCYSEALAFPADDLDKRTGSGMQCNEDNVLRAMQHRTPDSYSFCSSFISQPAVTTVTAYATNTVTSTASVTTTVHPMSLYNMQRYSDAQKPITYASPAQPSTIPGGGCDYPHGGYCSAVKNSKRTMEARQDSAGTTTTATGTIPSYLATVPASRISSGCSCLSVPYATTVTASATTAVTSTTSCTTYSRLPFTTLPYFCAPTLQVNAPAAPPPSSNITVAKPFTTTSKMDCCKACSDIFNCVWWKFDFAKPNADGSGNGWAPGTCTYAFNTVYDNTNYNPAAVCPNGGFYFFKGTSPSGLQIANNLPGYNLGPCGGGYDILQSSVDFGYPDNYYQSQCR